ncbi:MAG: MaoC/PaaZ C-terminal domain-containing protein [Bacteroidota bacterium]
MITKEFVFTKTFTISEKVYSNFLETFQDHNPLHTNKEFATSHGFEGIVMHGNILNGIISYFIGECLPMKNVIIHMQTIKFLNPVYLNDDVTLVAEVEDIYESVNSIAFKFYFNNQSGKKVAKGTVQIGLLK